MSRTRLIACVLLPFAAGYFLAYLFRTINAVIAVDLAAELHLSAAEMGVLTGAFFLTFAAAQLPLGILLDRLEPGLVHSTLMLLASLGALIFATADSFTALLIGRGLIGLGVAASLMAGAKAIVVWFPPGRLASATGTMVTLGALGALAATGPAEIVVQQIGWRALFVMLAALSAAAALVVLIAVPESSTHPTSPRRSASLSAVYRDPRFWRVAPLCAMGVGTSWSLQSLWVAPWLRDVDGLERATVVHHLSVMATAVCACAFLLGIAVDRLRKSGIKTEGLLVGTFAVSALAQLALILHWPLPPLLPWTVVAAAGAATVLSYALMSEYFPKSMSGRANSAINLLHVGAAFFLQSATGCVLAQWPSADGVYSLEAHQAGMAIPLVLQLAALAWFTAPRRRPLASMQRIAHRSALSAYGRPPSRSCAALAGFSAGGGRNQLTHRHAAGWRLAALASTTLCVALATALIAARSEAGFQIHMVNVEPQSVAAAGGPGGLLFGGVIQPRATAEAHELPTDFVATPYVDRGAESQWKTR